MNLAEIHGYRIPEKPFSFAMTDESQGKMGRIEVPDDDNVPVLLAPRGNERFFLVPIIGLKPEPYPHGAGKPRPSGGVLIGLKRHLARPSNRCIATLVTVDLAVERQWAHPLVLEGAKLHVGWGLRISSMWAQQRNVQMLTPKRDSCKEDSRKTLMLWARCRAITRIAPDLLNVSGYFLDERCLEVCRGENEDQSNNPWPCPAEREHFASRETATFQIPRRDRRTEPSAG